MATKILPWQAVLCPKAIETLRDIRQNMIHAKHVGFINQMKQKLEEKVMGFIAKKEEEVRPINIYTSTGATTSNAEGGYLDGPRD